MNLLGNENGRLMLRKDETEGSTAVLLPLAQLTTPSPPPDTLLDHLLRFSSFKATSQVLLLLASLQPHSLSWLTPAFPPILLS